MKTNVGVTIAILNANNQVVNNRRQGDNQGTSCM